MAGVSNTPRATANAATLTSSVETANSLPISEVGAAWMSP